MPDTSPSMSAVAPSGSSSRADPAPSSSETSTTGGTVVSPKSRSPSPSRSARGSATARPTVPNDAAFHPAAQEQRPVRRGVCRRGGVWHRHDVVASAGPRTAAAGPRASGRVDDRQPLLQLVQGDPALGQCLLEAAAARSRSASEIRIPGAASPPQGRAVPDAPPPPRLFTTSRRATRRPPADGQPGDAPRPVQHRRDVRIAGDHGHGRHPSASSSSCAAAAASADGDVPLAATSSAPRW